MLTNHQGDTLNISNIAKSIAPPKLSSFVLIKRTVHFYLIFTPNYRVYDCLIQNMGLEETELAYTKTHEERTAQLTNNSQPFRLHAYIVILSGKDINYLSKIKQNAGSYSNCKLYGAPLSYYRRYPHLQQERKRTNLQILLLYQ